MRDFNVGDVLGRSFSIWAKNLIPFTLITLLVYAPLVIYTLSLYSGELTLDSIQTWGIAVSVGGVVLELIATGAIIYGVFQQLRGNHASIGSCLSVGLGRLFPVLGVGLLVGLCIIGGFIALIVPGLIVLTMLYVSVPVAVVERPGLMASLKRSRELTRNHRLQIFGLVFVLGILEWGAQKIVEIALMGDNATMDDVKLFLLMTLLVSIVLSALGSVVSAVAYHDLRATKESIGIEELSSVFE